ncbi:hypothetical protein OPQ81_011032 [Rhizoctonia solani]|nr:hypothetical protein OPQ81_011032 [Rhizoctonia solani]
MVYPALLAALAGVVAARSPYDLPDSEWNTLNATVGGRLGRGVPLARDCYAQAGVNVTGPAPGLDCATVQNKYAADTWRAGIYGARMSLQWETCQKTNQGCLLDPNNPKNTSAFSAPQVCDQGGVSPYYIAIKTAADVTQAFAFSKRTGVPLSIKNTGHDYAGRSSAPGTLALWTNNIKYISYSTKFVPEGCQQDGVPALTYGAGQDFESIYLYADNNNLTFIGGKLQDCWVEVTASLVTLTASAPTGSYSSRLSRQTAAPGLPMPVKTRIYSGRCEAVGGGTFGVVLEATSEVIPNPVSTVSLRWQLTPTPDNLRAFFKILVENSLRWSQEGWGGFLYPTASLLANPRLNRTAAETSLKPLTDFLRVAPDGAGGGAGSGAQASWSQYNSFLPLLSSIVTGSATTKPRNFAMSSRLIPQSAFSNQTALLDAMLQSASIAGGSVSYYMTTPFSYQVPNTEQGKTSLTPAWRGAVWHALASTAWDFNAGTDAAKQAYIKVNSAMNPLRALTPGGGAYQNEADVYEPNASQSFWGSNYAALYGIKQKYDPDKLLDCWHCVGWQGKNTSIASCYF